MLKRVNAISSCLVGAALAALTSLPVVAQAAPVVLACPTPTSIGVTVDLSTAAGVWEIRAPGAGAYAAAAAAANGAWVAVPGAAWIGDGTTGVVGDYNYRVTLDASDPNIDLGSATVTFAYRTDNTMVSGSVGGTSLPVLPSATYNAPAPGTGGPTSTPLTAGSNEFLVVSNNAGGPYGLAMQATLTFNCAATVVTPVPANAPWAIFGLSALMLVGVAAMVRKRR